MSQLIGDLRNRNRIWPATIVLFVLGTSILLGFRASSNMLLMVGAGIAAFLLIRRPVIGLVFLFVIALVVRVKIGTGTAVNLNPLTLTIPVLVLLWLVSMVREREVRFVPSRTYLPLLLLLLLGSTSLLIGNALWDPFVPRPSNFLLVQLAQLAIFFLSAAAYLMVANMIHDEKWLGYLVWTFLTIAGLLAVFFIIPISRPVVSRVATEAFNRAPLWMLLMAVAGGQLLFNHSLSLLSVYC